MGLDVPPGQWPRLGPAGLHWGCWARPGHRSRPGDSAGGTDPGPQSDPGGHWELPRDGLIWGWETGLGLGRLVENCVYEIEETSFGLEVD